MIEALVFPSVRDALFGWIDGAEHMGEPVRAVYFLPADSYGTMEGPFPVCLIYVSSGPEGFVDRVERVVLEVYAPGTLAVETLESIRASIVGWDIEVPLTETLKDGTEREYSIYLDKVRCVEVPTDVPYQSDTLNKATAHFDVTVRPIT